MSRLPELKRQYKTLVVVTIIASALILWAGGALVNSLYSSINSATVVFLIKELIPLLPVAILLVLLHRFLFSQNGLASQEKTQPQVVTQNTGNYDEAIKAINERISTLQATNLRQLKDAQVKINDSTTQAIKAINDRLSAPQTNDLQQLKDAQAKINADNTNAIKATNDRISDLQTNDLQQLKDSANQNKAEISGHILPVLIKLDRSVSLLITNATLNEDEEKENEQISNVLLNHQEGMTIEEFRTIMKNHFLDTEQ